MSKIAKAVDINRKDFDMEGVGRGRARSGFSLDSDSYLRLDGSEVRKNRIIVGEQMEAALMSYNLLRTQVYKKVEQHKVATLGITSSRPGEGKSTTSINLALSLARAVQKSVILIDFDLRKPTVHTKLGLSDTKCLRDYYEGKSQLRDIVYQDASSGLYIIPGCGEMLHAGDVVGGKRTAQLMTELKKAFPSRLVLLDLPPILVVDEVTTLLDYIDSMLFIVSEGDSHKEDVKKSLELIGEDKLLGTVLNNSAETRRETSGYYNYYYGSSSN